jgi:hypothetical protein
VVGSSHKIKNDDYPRDKISDELRDIGGKLDNIKSAIEHLKR